MKMIHSMLLSCLLSLVVGRQASLVQWEEVATLSPLSSPSSLSCSSPDPWFFCVWEGPDRSRACGLSSAKGGIEQPHMCSGGDRLTITGNSTVCSLSVLSVAVGDHGTWTCSLSQDKSLDTVKAHRQLEVAVEGQVRLGLPEELMLGEGDTAELQCQVSPSFPRPSVSWSSDSQLWGLLDTNTQVFVDASPSSHLVSALQRVSYVADSRDSGANISCTASQIGSGGGRMYSNSQTVRLKILPVTALQSQLGESVGILTVILITITVLILVLVLVTMLVLKRRRTPKQEQTAEGIDLLKHVYTIQEQEKLGRLHETYEPLNVSFVDLYQSSATASSHSQSFESQAKSSSSGGRSDSGSSLVREEQGAQGEAAHRPGSCRSSYQETHFDSPHCPLHPHHTLHIVREGSRGGVSPLAPSPSVHLHTLPQPSHHHTLPLPSHHHQSLFDCQHSCFQHPPDLEAGGSE